MLNDNSPSTLMSDSNPRRADGLDVRRNTSRDNASMAMGRERRYDIASRSNLENNIGEDRKKESSLKRKEAEKTKIQGKRTTKKSEASATKLQKQDAVQFSGSEGYGEQEGDLGKGRSHKKTNETAYRFRRKTKETEKGVEKEVDRKASTEKPKRSQPKSKPVTAFGTTIYRQEPPAPPPPPPCPAPAQSVKRRPSSSIDRFGIGRGKKKSKDALNQATEEPEREGSTKRRPSTGRFDARRGEPEEGGGRARSSSTKRAKSPYQTSSSKLDTRKSMSKTRVEGDSKKKSETNVKHDDRGEIGRDLSFFEKIQQNVRAYFSPKAAELSAKFEDPPDKKKVTEGERPPKDERGVKEDFMKGDRNFFMYIESERRRFSDVRKEDISRLIVRKINKWSKANGIGLRSRRPGGNLACSCSDLVAREARTGEEHRELTCKKKVLYNKRSNNEYTEKPRKGSFHRSKTFQKNALAPPPPTTAKPSTSNSLFLEPDEQVENLHTPDGMASAFAQIQELYQEIDPYGESGDEGDADDDEHCGTGTTGRSGRTRRIRSACTVGRRMGGRLRSAPSSTEGDRGSRAKDTEVGGGGRGREMTSAEIKPRKSWFVYSVTEVKTGGCGTRREGSPREASARGYEASKALATGNTSQPVSLKDIINMSRRVFASESASTANGAKTRKRAAAEDKSNYSAGGRRRRRSKKKEERDDDEDEDDEADDTLGPYLDKLMSEKKKFLTLQSMKAPRRPRTENFVADSLNFFNLLNDEFMLTRTNNPTIEDLRSAIAEKTVTGMDDYLNMYKRVIKSSLAEPDRSLMDRAKLDLERYTDMYYDLMKCVCEEKASTSRDRHPRAERSRRASTSDGRRRKEESNSVKWDPVWCDKARQKIERSYYLTKIDGLRPEQDVSPFRRQHRIRESSSRGRDTREVALRRKPILEFPPTQQTEKSREEKAEIERQKKVLLTISMCDNGLIIKQVGSDGEQRQPPRLKIVDGVQKRDAKVGETAEKETEVRIPRRRSVSTTSVTTAGNDERKSPEAETSASATPRPSFVKDGSIGSRDSLSLGNPESSVLKFKAFQKLVADGLKCFNLRGDGEAHECPKIPKGGKIPDSMQMRRSFMECLNEKGYPERTPPKGKKKGSGKKSTTTATTMTPTKKKDKSPERSIHRPPPGIFTAADERARALLSLSPSRGKSRPKTAKSPSPSKSPTPTKSPKDAKKELFQREELRPKKGLNLWWRNVKAEDATSTGSPTPSLTFKPEPPRKLPAPLAGRPTAVWTPAQPQFSRSDRKQSSVKSSKKKKADETKKCESDAGKASTDGECLPAETCVGEAAKVETAEKATVAVQAMPMDDPVESEDSVVVTQGDGGGDDEAVDLGSAKSYPEEEDDDDLSYSTPPGSFLEWRFGTKNLKEVDKSAETVTLDADAMASSTARDDSSLGSSLPGTTAASLHSATPSLAKPSTVEPETKEFQATRGSQPMLLANAMFENPFQQNLEKLVEATGGKDYDKAAEVLEQFLGNISEAWRAAVCLKDLIKPKMSSLEEVLQRPPSPPIMVQRLLASPVVEQVRVLSETCPVPRPLTLCRSAQSRRFPSPPPPPPSPPPPPPPPEKQSETEMATTEPEPLPEPEPKKTEEAETETEPEPEPEPIPVPERKSPPPAIEDSPEAAEMVNSFRHFLRITTNIFEEDADERRVRRELHKLTKELLQSSSSMTVFRDLDSEYEMKFAREVSKLPRELSRLITNELVVNADGFNIVEEEYDPTTFLAAIRNVGDKIRKKYFGEEERRVVKDVATIRRGARGVAPIRRETKEVVSREVAKRAPVHKQKSRQKSKERPAPPPQPPPPTPPPQQQESKALACRPKKIYYRPTKPVVHMKEEDSEVLIKSNLRSLADKIKDMYRGGDSPGRSPPPTPPAILPAQPEKPIVKTGAPDKPPPVYYDAECEEDEFEETVAAVEETQLTPLDESYFSLNAKSFAKYRDIIYDKIIGFLKSDNPGNISYGMALLGKMMDRDKILAPSSSENSRKEEEEEMGQRKSWSRFLDMLTDVCNVIGSEVESQAEKCARQDEKGSSERGDDMELGRTCEYLRDQVKRMKEIIGEMKAGDGGADERKSTSGKEALAKSRQTNKERQLTSVAQGSSQNLFDNAIDFINIFGRIGGTFDKFSKSILPNWLSGSTVQACPEVIATGAVRDAISPSVPQGSDLILSSNREIVRTLKKKIEKRQQKIKDMIDQATRDGIRREVSLANEKVMRKVRDLKKCYVVLERMILDPTMLPPKWMKFADGRIPALEDEERDSGALDRRSSAGTIGERASVMSLLEKIMAGAGVGAEGNKRKTFPKTILEESFIRCSQSALSVPSRSGGGSSIREKSIGSLTWIKINYAKLNLERGQSGLARLVARPKTA